MAGESRADSNLQRGQRTEDGSVETAKFEYVKGNFFRVVHADGIFGGVTPNRNIHMAIFSQRGAIPNFTEQEIVDGRLGNEIRREGKNWVIRELEVDVVMSLDTAHGLRAWLDDKIRLLEDDDDQG